MDLREFILREQIRDEEYNQKLVADLLGISPHAFNRIVKKKSTPNLLTAINIVKFTDNQVTFEDLLSKKDKKVFNDKTEKKSA